jgi:MFS family permease
VQHEHGIRANAAQFLLQLLQVLLVGLTLGMLRTVVPALAEAEFGVPKGSFLLLASFVVAFGVVKGALNFLAGRLSERIGRREVLRLGWLVALPIPVIVWWAPSWSWIVLATVLLGVNQGLTWSMTQTAKLDLTRADQRGLTLGLNEFSGYVGVAIAGVATGYLAESLGARDGLLRGRAGAGHHPAVGQGNAPLGARRGCAAPRRNGRRPGAALPHGTAWATRHLGHLRADVVA